MSQHQTGDLFENDTPKQKKLVRRDGITQIPAGTLSMGDHSQSGNNENRPGTS